MSVSADIARIRAEVQQLREEMEKLQPLLVRSPQLISEWRELEKVALRYLVVSKRVGLPDDINRAIDDISRLIILARMAERTLYMLFTFTGPLGLAAAIASGLGTVYGFADMVADTY